MIVGIFEEEKESSSSLFQRYKPCRCLDGLYKVSGVCVFTLNGGKDLISSCLLKPLFNILLYVVASQICFLNWLRCMYVCVYGISNHAFSHLSIQRFIFTFYIT